MLGREQRVGMVDGGRVGQSGFRLREDVGAVVVCDARRAGGWVLGSVVDDERVGKHWHDVGVD